MHSSIIAVGIRFLFLYLTIILNYTTKTLFFDRYRRILYGVIKIPAGYKTGSLRRTLTGGLQKNSEQ